VILASAGTGKTFRLTSRYIALLAAGASAERILATTFTRKAAGEILRRILTRLSDAALDPVAADALSGQIRRPAPMNIGPEAWRELLVSLVRRMGRLQVSTLDAFFARLAGGLSLELGGAVAWRIADDDAMQSLRDAAVGEVLRSRDRDGLLQLLRRRSPGLMSRSIHGDVRRAVMEMLEAYLDSTPDAWERVVAPPFDPGELRLAVESLANLPLPTTAKGAPHKVWSKAIDNCISGGRRCDWKAIAALTIFERIAAGEEKFSGTEIPPEVRAAFAPIIRGVRAALIRDVAECNRATRELLARVDRELWGVKLARGLLAFDDVPRMILDASLSDRLHLLYYRLDGKLSHILLDEFQDTSIVQWKLIRPLVEEIVAGEGTDRDDGREGGGLPGLPAVAGPSRSLLCVGDVKQSLYGWRHAEPDLLPMLPQEWPQISVERLALNRRSSQVIMDAVNAVFGAIGTNPAFTNEEFPDRRAAEKWREQFEEHTAQRTLPGCVRLHAMDPACERADTLRFAAERIARTLEARPQGSIGVLFRARKDIPRLKHMLWERHQIRASEEGGNPLTESPAAAAAVSLLTLADHPGDAAAKFHVASTPLGAALGLTRESSAEQTAAVAAGVRAQLSGLGLARTIQKWAVAVRDQCDPHDADRLHRLVLLATEFESRPDVGGAADAAAGFVRLVGVRRVDDPSAAAVRLMSIHGSKGLEFDSVILCDLEASFFKASPSVLTARETIDGPLVVASVPASAAVRKLDPLLREMYAEWRSRVVRDEICALYVAMTRAVYSLEMIAAAPKGDSSSVSFARVLFGALASSPTDAPRERSDPAPAESEHAATPIWEIGDPLWREHLTSPAAPPATSHEPSPTPLADTPSLFAPTPTAPPPAAALALDWARRTRFLPALTASRREPNPFADGDAALLPEARDARERGLLVHAWLQLIGFLEDGEPSLATLMHVASDLPLAPGLDVAALAAAFRRELRSPALAGALSRSVHESAPSLRAHVWRELPFIVPGRDGASVNSGRFDRLVVVSEHAPEARGAVADGRAVLKTPADLHSGRVRLVEVVDFKTGREHASGPGREARDVAYARQLRIYEHAASKMLGVDPALVRSRLVYLSL